MPVIAMELPSGRTEEAVREAIASKIGMHLWQLSILRVQQQDCRNMQLVEFEIVADRAQLDKLASQSKAISLDLVWTAQWGLLVQTTFPTPTAVAQITPLHPQQWEAVAQVGPHTHGSAQIDS